MRDLGSSTSLSCVSRPSGLGQQSIFEAPYVSLLSIPAGELDTVANKVVSEFEGLCAGFGF